MRTLSWDVDAEYAGGSSLPQMPTVVGAGGNGFAVVPTMTSRITSAELDEGGATSSRGPCAGTFAIVTGAARVVVQGGGTLTAVG